MTGKDREGWKDDRGAEDRTQWRSGDGQSSSRGSRVFRDQKGTEPGDGPSGERKYKEGRETTIPDTLRALYGILVVLSGPRRFDTCQIGQRKVTIGRDQTDIAIDDSAIGRQHAVITVTGNDETDAEFRIIDRGSDGLPTKAGTLVNGRHITEAVLHDRDRIQVGETELLFIRLWPEVR